MSNNQKSRDRKKRRLAIPPSLPPADRTTIRSSNSNTANMETMDKDGDPWEEKWNYFVEKYGKEEAEKIKNAAVNCGEKERFWRGTDEYREGLLEGVFQSRFVRLSSDDVNEAVKILTADLADKSRSISSGRPGILDGLETNLAHRFDLDAFSMRIDQLFHWHKHANVCQEYRAPYFALVQSSGMGKTKLFTEFRKLYNQSPNCMCKTILCVTANLNKEDEEMYFDARLVMDPTDENIVDKVGEKLDTIVQDVPKETSLVLLFDEAQGLMVKSNNFGENIAFRTVRWWLREKRTDGIKIVAVFAGTTAKLSNFFAPDPPTPGVSRRSTVTYINYDRNEDGKDDKKLYPPFFELHTIGCLRSSVESIREPANDYNPGFPQAAIFGRPLFAHYWLENSLTDSKKMSEFLKRLVLSVVPLYENHLPSCYSVLGSRVQMGKVNAFETVTDLVSSGYACLVDFAQQESKESNPSAAVAFLPDPVCATLAMRLMDEKWKDLETGIKGKDKKFWVGKAEKAFSNGLCLPEKGDVGEIFGALYMLFCGDLLRQKIGNNYSLFAISLDDWFSALKHGGEQEESSSVDQKAIVAEMTETFLNDVESRTTRSETRVQTRAQTRSQHQVEKMGKSDNTISFVQVCRNDFRSSSFCEEKTLEFLFRAGLGSYTFKNCKAFDFVSSVRVKQNSQVNYHPLLVSVKNWAKVTKGDVVGWLSTMMSFLAETHGSDGTRPTAVCLILLLGCSSCPELKEDGLSSDSLKPFPIKDVFRLVRVKDGDAFGVSEAINKLGGSGEASEIYASHAFLPHEVSSKHTLRASSSNQDKVDRLFQALSLKDNNNNMDFQPT